MNICAECKHVKLFGYDITPICIRPVGDMDIVTGYIPWLREECRKERSTGECGIAGKFWEASNTYWGIKTD